MQEGALARVVEETIVDRLRGQHRAQRQEAAGQALGQAQQVGLDAGLFASEHRAGAAEADRDLVGDQEHAVHVAQFAHALEVHRVVHAHAAGALHARFQDQRADFARMLVEQACQRVGGFLRAGRGRLAFARGVGVGRGREQRLEQQRRIDAAIQRDVAHRQRADGFAVVAVAQRDEARAPRLVAAVAEPVEGHLQRHLDAGRAVVGVEHLGQRVAPRLARGDGQQALGQFHRRGMRAAGEDHLLQRARLPCDRPGDARLGVAEQVGPPAAHRVERAAAIVADQQRRAAYAADITYGTNNEFGFDYLRDNMKYDRAQMVQRPFNFAIVDEVDSILIDEARTPLIISGPTDDKSELYISVDAIVKQLVPEDYEVDEKQKSVVLTEDGTEKIERMFENAGVLVGSNLYDFENTQVVQHLNQALDRTSTRLNSSH